MKILIDTREKQPWKFHHPDVQGTEAKKLDTGDYSIEGLEDSVCIERKKSVPELATCVTSARFTRELERMSTYSYRYLIFEFSIEDVLKYPEGSTIPRARWAKLKVKGKYIMKRLGEIERKYGLQIVFADSAMDAELKTIEIMKTICNERIPTYTQTPHS
jgi:ERCC4-type nuclease